jgi:hypothetical protein
MKYSEIINIQQFLNIESNIDKVIYFFKDSNNSFNKTISTINDKYRIIFIDKEKFNIYYNESINESYYKLLDNNICTGISDKVSVNLNKLYELEKFLSDENVFNLFNNKKYFPLKKGDLCYMTNLPKLNVIIWLIKIGFYDYLIEES